MIDLSGRVALVTGSSRGIGKECAIRLAEAGADIIVNYSTSKTAAEEVAKTIQRLGRRVAIVKADVTWQEDVISMMKFVDDAFGSLDILVSNAASGGFRPLTGTTALNFEAAMNTNVRALLFLVQAALPMLERSKGHAKVIGLSSHGSVLALPMYGLVGSTKAAMESLIRHFALELGNRKINFNILRAGLVETDSSRNLPYFKEMAQVSAARSLSGAKILYAKDVADAVLFLSSSLSDLIQGQTLVVDGGASIRA